VASPPVHEAIDRAPGELRANLGRAERVFQRPLRRRAFPRERPARFLDPLAPPEFVEDGNRLVMLQPLELRRVGLARGDRKQREQADR
jgi:hypothetical protein